MDGRPAVISLGTFASVCGFFRFFIDTTGRVFFSRRREPAIRAFCYS